ncbi:MAG TPA: DUF4258 domain-containing protein [Opitutales bacterium]|nr:DUF4258 domain-containing protein [Opitutales bacterium]
MDATFTEHAKHALGMRCIDKQWVFATLENPELRETDPNDKELERFYKGVPERENRVLRVVVNTKLAPWRIVSVFFDRRMRGKL